MIDVPIDNPKRVKEIFMSGDDRRAELGKPAQATTARAIEQQLAQQQDLTSDLHSVIAALSGRLEKVIITRPTCEEDKGIEREELSAIAHNIRLNNDSLLSAIGLIRCLTDEIEL